MDASQHSYLEASKSIGIHEIPGSTNSDEIMNMFAVCGHSWVNSEATPWCSAFVNFVCYSCNLPMTRSLRARSWSLVQGNERVKPVRIESIGELRQGDIVLLWREQRNSAKGHIAFFASHRDRRLYLLGGNQSNRVCVKAYPDYRFLHGIRFV